MVRYDKVHEVVNIDIDFIMKGERDEGKIN